MAPSDMLLRIGQVAGYNNEIVVATGGQKLGVNAGANVAKPPPNAAGEKRHCCPTRTQRWQAGGCRADSEDDDEKTALIVGGVSASLLWLISSR